MVLAVERHAAFGPEPAQQLDLLADPRPTVGELLAERFVLNSVPTKSNTQTKPALAEDIECRSLLGDQRRLTLGKDDDRGDKLQRSQRRDVPEQHERLEERRIDVVRVGADDVVVGEQVREPQPLDVLGVGPNGTRVGANLGLREHHPDAQRRIHASSDPTPDTQRRRSVPLPAAPMPIAAQELSTRSHLAPRERRPRVAAGDCCRANCDCHPRAECRRAGLRG